MRTVFQPLARLWAVLLLALATCFMPGPAQAEVAVSFHSFNGSVVWGRYPHAFVVFEGTLDETGAPVHENYGFSATSAGPQVLLGPVKHGMYTEKDKYIRTTNRHFTVPVSDATS